LHYDADEKWSTNPSTDEVDLESVAVHEIGHLLGLDHSMDQNSIMFAEIPPGTIKRELGQDDIAGIRALYSN
jgi:predicted Zn-dependent protease